MCVSLIQIWYRKLYPHIFNAVEWWSWNTPKTIARTSGHTKSMKSTLKFLNLVVRLKRLAFFHWASSFKKTKNVSSGPDVWKCHWGPSSGFSFEAVQTHKTLPRSLSLHSWYQLVPYRNRDRSLDQEDSFSWRTGKRVQFKADVQCGIRPT